MLHFFNNKSESHNNLLFDFYQDPREIQQSPVTTESQEPPVVTECPKRQAVPAVPECPDRPETPVPDFVLSRDFYWEQDEILISNRL